MVKWLWAKLLAFISSTRKRLSFRMLYDSKQKNPAVVSLLNGTAPQPVRLAAARGILPLPQDDLLEVLVAIADGTDPELSKTASGTIASQDAKAIESLVRSDSLSPTVLSHLINRAALPNTLYESVVTN